MGKSRAPSPPDPRETAAASTGTNVATALANAFMGNVNQVTPDGSLTYDQTDTYTFKDPYTGQSYEIPRFTATQQLSPEQEVIRQQTVGAQTNLAGLANDQSAFLKDYMQKPFEFNDADASNWAYDLGSQRLDPRFAQEEETLRTRLLNSGIREGSQAWKSEMDRLGQSKNDAYNSLQLQGRSQAFNEALTGRNQPINEIIGLMSGSQVQQPNFVNTQQPTIPTTDTAGLINENYNQRVNAYQQQQRGLGGLFSGLGSLGGSLLGAPSTSVFGGLMGLSDDKTKTDKKKVGETNGMGLYSYRYKGEPKGKKHVGMMASEVQRKMPAAVTRGSDGLRRVDYGKALGLMGS